MEKESRNADIEELLLQIAKYPIIASQINGYFPLSIRKTFSHPNNVPFHRLTLSVTSLPFIYCLIQILFLPLMLFKLFSLSSSFIASATKGVATDGVTLNVLAAMYILNPFFLRITGIFGSGRTLDFWKTNVYILGKIFADDFSLSTRTTELVKLKSQSRFAFFVTVAISAIGTFAFTYLGNVLVFLGLEEESRGSTYVAQSDISSQLFFVILPMFALSHPLGVSLIVLFPKLYSVCLQVIADKLKALSCKSPTKLGPFVIKRTFSNGDNKKEMKLNSEDEVISQVIEMYEDTLKLSKEYNLHFGSRLLGEIVHCMLSILGFTYFAFVWSSEGQYSSSFFVTFCSYVRGANVRVGVCW